MFRLTRKPFSLIVKVPDSIWKTVFKKGYNGYAFTFIVFVKRTDYSMSIVEHELVHVQQFYNEPIMQAYKYMTKNKYRLMYEAEAYAHQLLWMMYEDGYRIDKYEDIKDTVYYKGLFNNFSYSLKHAYKLSYIDSVYDSALTIAVIKSIIDNTHKRFYLETSIKTKKKIHDTN